MKFKNKQFSADLNEAFAYWKQMKLDAAPEAQRDEVAKKLGDYTLERWIMETMSKPVYDLIRAKRMQDG